MTPPLNENWTGTSLSDELIIKHWKNKTKNFKEKISCARLVDKVLGLEKTVKKITALPQMSKLAGRDAEIMNSRVKGTKYEYLASPAVTLTTDDNSAEAIQNEQASHEIRP